MKRNKIMKYFILGEEGKIGQSFKEKILTRKLGTIVNDESESDVIVLCVNSETAKKYIKKYDDKILVNFSSYRKRKYKSNVINGIGCSTLSVLKPLELIKEYYDLIENINVNVLFPQTSLSNKSKYKDSKLNVPIYTLNHNHQNELKKLTGLDINMSHFITPAEKFLTSSIMITFKDKKYKKNIKSNLKNFNIYTRDEKTWNIISVIDNIEEPIEYVLEKLKARNIIIKY